MKNGNYITGTLLTILLLAGCVPTRHLKGNEKLLYDVELNGIEQSDPEMIRALYRQKPNRKVPLLGWTPYLSVYYLGKSFYNPAKIERDFDKLRTKYEKKINKAGSDSSEVTDLVEKYDKKRAKLTRKKEEGNWLMRSIGEPPSIYDSTLTVETVSQIHTFLNSKGYFYNRVNAETNVKEKKVYLTLQVQENTPFKFTDFSYAIPDTALARLVQQNAAQSLLIKDENYDEAILTRERDRLEMLLRNQGYYDFRKQYITFDVDTSYGGNSVRVATVIANPNQGRFHKKYTIRNIYFVEDAGLKRFGVNRDTVVFEGVHYLAYDQYVSPKILDKKVRFGPGQPYSLIRVNRTQRQVTDLDVYRYTAINFNATPDTVNPQLDAFINVTAAKRYQETVEAGINISTFSAAQLSPLPFGSLRLKVRNIFGGAENLEFGVRGGFEGQPSATRDEIVTTTELGTNLALYFPQFLIPFPRYLDPTYGRSRDPLRIYNPRTRLNAAFTYTDREDYTRTNTELSLAYFWQRSQQLQWVVSIADINIVNVPFLSERFRTQLQGWASNGQPLIESFRSAVLSGVNATRLYNSNDLNQTRDAKFLKLYAEIGNVPRVLSLGKLPGFSNLFTEFTANSDGTDRYRAFSFAKVNADGRRYIKIREKMFVVGRANLGLATPVPGGRNNILPYEKFYFAGGGSSIRAWRPRKLGPGSYSPPFLEEDGQIVRVNGFPQRDYSFEQPGEILIEFNTEYRFNIFSIWDGALFIDAGNTWMVNSDPSRPGAQFTRNFWKEMAVGGGFGFRFDFTFLILRFDIATKIFDPAEPEGERYVLNRFRFNSNLLNAKNTQNSFNLGIGYPF